jgi:hypothetical protein
VASCAGHPEQVVRRGVDHRVLRPGTDLQVIEVGVVVKGHRGYGLGAGFSGVSVGSEDLPTLSWLMGMAAPEASRTLVVAVKPSPPQVAPILLASRASPSPLTCPHRSSSTGRQRPESR